MQLKLISHLDAVSSVCLSFITTLIWHVQNVSNNNLTICRVKWLHTFCNSNKCSAKNLSFGYCMVLSPYPLVILH